MRTTPVEESSTISEPVSREEVSVTRVPIGRIIEQAPRTREEGETTIIPVVEERARVIVEQVLMEEIHVRRVRRREMAELEVKLRRTKVQIDEEPG